MLGFPDCILYCLENLKSWTFISEFLSVLRLLLRERKESSGYSYRGRRRHAKRSCGRGAGILTVVQKRFLKMNLICVKYPGSGACFISLAGCFVCAPVFLSPVCLSAWVITESPACPSHRLSRFGCAPASLCSARRKAHISGFMLHVE